MTKPKINIDLTVSDLDELMDGKTFDWMFIADDGQEVDVHLYNSDREGE